MFSSLNREIFSPRHQGDSNNWKPSSYSWGPDTVVMDERKTQETLRMVGDSKGVTRVQGDGNSLWDGAVWNTAQSR